MAHYEKDLTSDNSCKGVIGAYAAKIYFVRGNETRPQQVSLGKLSEVVETPKSVITEAYHRLKSQKYTANVLPEDLVALSVMRLCMLKNHDDGRVTPDNEDAELELHSNYAITRRGTHPEPIRALQIPNILGIGAAEREQGLRGIQTVVHLPFYEQRVTDVMGYQVEKVVKAYPSIAVGLQPYVAMHTLPGKHVPLEQVVHFDEIFEDGAS
jgi:hypothetical protein